MNQSLFWQDGFPKERRRELVAELLYSGKPNARIPNDEGLKPDRVDDFYRAVAFGDIEDFRARMKEVRAKYDEPKPLPLEVALPDVPPPSLPSVDPFEAFFTSAAEIPTPEPEVVVPPIVAAKPRLRSRPRATERLRVVPTPIAPLRRPAVAPKQMVTERVSTVSEAPVPVPVIHPEDRVSALARAVRSWFGQASVESPAARAYEEAPTRAQILDAARGVIERTRSKKNDADARTRASIDAAKRLERAVATSRMAAAQRDEVHANVVELREQYEHECRDADAVRRRELDAILEDSSELETSSALRVLAVHPSGIAEDFEAFREQVEYRVTHGGGARFVDRVEDAFRSAWESVAPQTMSTGEALEVISGGDAPEVLEESLPGLRLIAGGRRSGVGMLVTEARLAMQDRIDKALPGLERATKRAA